MASIKKRKSGKWQVLIRKKGYPLICKSFMSKGEASTYARTVESEIDRKLFNNTTSIDNTTLETLLIKYRDEIVPGYKSRETLTSKINHLLRYKICKYSISHLTTEHITEFKRAIMPGRAAKTINGYIQTLHTVWKMASSQFGYTMPLQNPFKLVPLLKVRNERDITITDAQLFKLLDCAAKVKNHSYLVNFIKFAAITSARYQEILDLKKQDVDFNKCCCTFRDTKNGEDRTIPLSQESMAILKEQRTFGDHFFVIKHSGSFRKMWRKLRSNAGLDGFRFHDLRSFAIRKMLLSGMQTIEVARISGHKTLAVLHRRYSRLKAEDLIEKVNNVVLLRSV